MDPLAIYNPVAETEFYGDGQHNGGVFYWGNLNPYIYTYQNPIKYIDPNGKQTLGQQIGIAVRNPFKIGLMKRAGMDLERIAGEFSRRGATPDSPFAVLDRNGPVASDADRGGERGAFRHSFWMAMIASEYGSKNAKWVGDIHEGKSTDTSNRSDILTIGAADTIADELNNEIGRAYGEKHKGADSRDLALGVLETYNKEGLYQVESGNGANRFNVVRKKLSDEKYNQLKNRFQNLSNDGVSPKPTKTETQKAQKNYIKNGTP